MLTQYLRQMNNNSTSAIEREDLKLMAIETIAMIFTMILMMITFKICNLGSLWDILPISKWEKTARARLRQLRKQQQAIRNLSIKPSPFTNLEIIDVSMAGSLKSRMIPFSFYSYLQKFWNLVSLWNRFWERRVLQTCTKIYINGILFYIIDEKQIPHSRRVIWIVIFFPKDRIVPGFAVISFYQNLDDFTEIQYRMNEEWEVLITLPALGGVDWPSPYQIVTQHSGRYSNRIMTVSEETGSEIKEPNRELFISNFLLGLCRVLNLSFGNHLNFPNAYKIDSYVKTPSGNYVLSPIGTAGVTKDYDNSTDIDHQKIARSILDLYSPPYTGDAERIIDPAQENRCDLMNEKKIPVHIIEFIMWLLGSSEPRPTLDHIILAAGYIGAIATATADDPNVEHPKYLIDLVFANIFSFTQDKQKLLLLTALPSYIGEKIAAAQLLKLQRS